MEFQRIQALDSTLANQIAAGEVVERPASALKELVENSLDAGATYITIKAAEGGVKLLEVVDNGHGIHPDDFQLALGRHATSKIRTTEDLFAIRSWGFRGEALASIAAVSRLTLNSRVSSEPRGKELILEGGTLRGEKELARPQGTTIRVEELFFNTPARRKFLKSQGAETAQLWQTLHRLALGSAEVAFEAWQDGEKIFHYPAVPSPAARVVQVFREAFGLSDLEEKDLAKLEAESSPLKMRGWVLSSRLFIPSSRGILTFVNGRSVKDKLLQQAILAAAKEVLFGKLYPQLVLHLDAPPDWVDVNVHPAKSEVRFKEPGHVFGFVRKHLEKLLADDRRGSIALSPLDAPISQAETLADLLLPLPETAVHYHQKGVQDISPIPDLIPGALHSAPPAPVLSPAMGGPQFLGTLRNTYLVCQDSDGLLLVDQHAAHERVTYERLKNTRLLGSGSQPLLISLQVELPRQTLDRIEADFPRLANFGLVCERTGPTLVAIREMPSLLFKRDGNPALPAGELLRKIVNDWDENAGEGMEARLREILLHELATMSCHGSVRAGQSLSAVEAEALLKQMSATDFSGHCPHGRPTTVRFSWSELERLFKRLV